MEIYLDNSATTRPYKRVCDKVLDVMQETYGNPSSLHRLGIAAEKEIKAAKESLAAAFGVRPDEILFTSGGTESNNIAILGTCGARVLGAKLVFPKYGTLQSLLLCYPVSWIFVAIINISMLYCICRDLHRGKLGRWSSILMGKNADVWRKTNA